VNNTNTDRNDQQLTRTKRRQAMRYVMMICNDETRLVEQSDEQNTAMNDAYVRFGEEMGGRGVLRDGARLRPTCDATTVRVRDGEVLAADGPFAETKEQIGGYYVVECADLDEAIEIAAKIPHASNGTIEIRPIREP
jgi:hypothetical protein